MRTLRHIALVGVQLHGNDAGMLRGVFRYVHQHRPDWVIHDTTRPAAWSADPGNRPCGVLANVVMRKTSERCRELAVPVISLSGPMPSLHRFPTVTVDDDAVGVQAAEHLLGCGLRRFAWFNHMTAFPFIGQRGRAFAARLAKRGFACEVFDEEVPLTGHAPGSKQRRRPAPLLRWLAALPKPCGIFATTDHGGRELCWLCGQAGFHVPEDVAVLGVDDFDLICATSHPPLSSVRLPNEAIGYAAAAALDGLLRGRPAAPLTLLSPCGVHVRQSTDTVAVEDRAVAAAVAFVRRHAAERPHVGDVARAVGVNRRSLERRFRAALGRSVLAEIHGSLVARARELLEGADLPVGEVAVRAGFRDHRHMGAIFRIATGLSPRAYRHQARTPRHP